jgi:hypothetical protein
MKTGVPDSVTVAISIRPETAPAGMLAESVGELVTGYRLTQRAPTEKIAHDTPVFRLHSVH